MDLSLTVNGRAVSAQIEPRTLLAQFIRDGLGMTGTHVGCDTTQCGACTVHVDGVAVKSCTMLAAQAEGCAVSTIESLARGDDLHPMQAAFHTHHGLQCGFCTPGMVMAAVALAKDDPMADEAAIRHGLDGNICRCTGYHNIVKAVAAGAALMRGDAVAPPAHADAGGQIIGRSIPRKEDQRLLTGAGRYSDDVSLPGQAHAAMVRSPHPHARIVSIDSAAALQAPGVLAVLTGADLVADGLSPIPHNPWPSRPPDVALDNRDGSAVFQTTHYPLPIDKARFVGEAVAMVVAETGDQARDAAELVWVDYEDLPAVSQAMAAAGSAELVWEEAGSNLILDAEIGDRAATDAAFARAAHVVSLDTQVQRVTAVSMEPRAAVAAYDAATGRYTVHAGSGGVVRARRELARVLGVPVDQVRVTAGDVGGNFGSRNALYPEFALVAWAARRLGRPVKWAAERRESFLTDHQARDLHVSAQLALDAEGRFLAIRGVNTSNIGAHTVSFIPVTKGVELMTSVYDIPAAFFGARGVLTNTAPTAPYRSAGRPEVMFAIERLIDIACLEHGFNRVAIRRLNLVREDAMPYAAPLGMTYDSGAYAQAMDKALALGDWAGFSARRDEAKARGRLRGIGVANYIETSSGVTRERAQVAVRADGWVDVVIGTLSSGQGHETSFAQLVSDWLGVPWDRIRLLTGDTDFVTEGGGTHSGRSMRMAGIVIGGAVRQIVEDGKAAAAEMLDLPAADIDFSGGRFSGRLHNRSVGLFEVAEAAEGGLLQAECDETVPIAQFPYGAHVCEVEVDPDTGLVDLVAYAAVDDVGRAVNPLIIHGQTHGGIAQGVGQALMEHQLYEADSGQLLTASFMDYAMPKAASLPFFKAQISEVPSVTHPLGMRAGGEGGVTPALAAAINAVVHALQPFGVRHLEMPATAQRVWQAIQDARSGSPVG